MSTHTMTFDTRRARTNIRKILALLKAQPMTMNELAEAMNVQRVTAWLYVTHIRQKPGRIRIVGYELISARYAPIFQACKGEDALKITRRQSERLSKELPLRERILALLKMTPGHTVRDMAQRFEASYGSVWNVIDRLHHKGDIQIAGRSEAGEYRWSLADKAAPQPTIKPQPSWASALGI